VQDWSFLLPPSFSPQRRWHTYHTANIHGKGATSDDINFWECLTLYIVHNSRKNKTAKRGFPKTRVYTSIHSLLRSVITIHDMHWAILRVGKNKVMHLHCHCGHDTRHIRTSWGDSLSCWRALRRHGQLSITVTSNWLFVNSRALSLVLFLFLLFFWRFFLCVYLPFKYLSLSGVMVRVPLLATGRQWSAAGGGSGGANDQLDVPFGLFWRVYACVGLCCFFLFFEGSILNTTLAVRLSFFLSSFLSFFLCFSVFACLSLLLFLRSHGASSSNGSSRCREATANDT